MPYEYVETNLDGVAGKNKRITKLESDVSKDENDHDSKYYLSSSGGNSKSDSFYVGRSEDLSVKLKDEDYVSNNGTNSETSPSHIELTTDHPGFEESNSFWIPTQDDYGQVYYVHSITGESSWTLPTNSNDLPPPAEDSNANGADIIDDYTEVCHAARKVIIYMKKCISKSEHPVIPYDMKTVEDIASGRGEDVWEYTQDMLDNHNDNLSSTVDNKHHLTTDSSFLSISALRKKFHQLSFREMKLQEALDDTRYDLLQLTKVIEAETSTDVPNDDRTLQSMNNDLENIPHHRVFGMFSSSSGFPSVLFESGHVVDGLVAFALWCGYKGESDDVYKFEYDVYTEANKALINMFLGYHHNISNKTMFQLATVISENEDPYPYEFVCKLSSFEPDTLMNIKKAVNEKTLFETEVNDICISHCNILARNGDDVQDSTISDTSLEKRNVYDKPVKSFTQESVNFKDFIEKEFRSYKDDLIENMALISVLETDIENELQTSNGILEQDIKGTSAEIERIANKIRLAQNKIAASEARYRGLKIKRNRPTPPKEPLPLPLLTMPPLTMAEAGESASNIIDDELIDGYLSEISQMGRVPDKLNLNEIPTKSVSKESYQLIETAIKERNIAIAEVNTKGQEEYECSMKKYKNANDRFETAEIEKAKDIAETKRSLWLQNKALCHHRKLKKLYEEELLIREGRLKTHISEARNIRTRIKRDKVISVKLDVEAANLKEVIKHSSKDLDDALEYLKSSFSFKVETEYSLDSLESERRRNQLFRALSLKLSKVRMILKREGRKFHSTCKHQRILLLSRLDYLKEFIKLQQDHQHLEEVRRHLHEQRVNFQVTIYQEKISSCPEEPTISEYNLNDCSDDDEFDDIHNNCHSMIYRAIENICQRDKILIMKSSSQLYLFHEDEDNDLLLRIEKDKLLEENTRLKAELGSIGTIMSKIVINSHDRIAALDRKIAYLRNVIVRCQKHHAINLKRAHEVSQATVRMLKKRLQSLGDNHSQLEKLNKMRISRLLHDQQISHHNYEMKIDALEKTLIRQKEISTFHRKKLEHLYDKEKKTNSELLNQTKKRLKIDSNLKQRLVREYKRSKRLELLVHTLRRYIVWMRLSCSQKDKCFQEERLKFHENIQKSQQELKMHLFAMKLLCTNVDMLFTFFIERLVTLSGTRKEHNDALRYNGALLVCSALFKSPRKDLQHLLFKIMANMCWDRCVDAFKVEWDVAVSWKAWIDEVKRRNLCSDQSKRCFQETSVPLDDEQLSFSHNCIRKYRIDKYERIRLNEGPNRKNQVLLAKNEYLVRMMLKTLSYNDPYLCQTVLYGLCASSYDEIAANELGRINHLLNIPFEMFKSSSDISIKKKAGIFLANMMLEKKCYQEDILAFDGIKTFLEHLSVPAHDVVSLESATAALACLLRNNPSASKILIEGYGIRVLLDTLLSPHVISIEDENRTNEVYANASECLFYILSTDAYDYHDNPLLRDDDIKMIVSLAASTSTKVQINVATIIGKLSHEKEYRRLIATQGGVEVLFMLCDNHSLDVDVKVCAFWALSALAWDSFNQERIGKCMKNLIEACMYGEESIREVALCCLVNSLHYNSKNRERFTKYQENIFDFIEYLQKKASSLVTVYLLTIISSMTYDDNIALVLGRDKRVWYYLRECIKGTVEMKKVTGTILLNFILHSEFKEIIASDEWLQIITSLQGDDEIHEISKKLVSLLVQVEITKQPQECKQISCDDIKDLIKLCSSTNEDTQKLALDKLSEAIASDDDYNAEFIDSAGIESLIVLLNEYERMNHENLISALRTLRNSSERNNRSKNIFGLKGGIKTLLRILEFSLIGANYVILGNALGALLCLAVDHEQNSRRIIQYGLDLVIHIAEQSLDACTKVNDDKIVDFDEAVSIATSLLQCIGKYCYVTCTNCNLHQSSYLGTTCSNCGRNILTQSEKSQGGIVSDENINFINSKCNLLSNKIMKKGLL